MKLYIVQEVGYEYDDEFYRHRGIKGPVRAFRDKKNADAECGKLNAKAAAERRYEHGDEDGKITEYYTVATVDAPDDEVGYADAKKTVKEALAEAKKAAKAAFKAGAADLFAKYDDLESFGYKGYTPGFCDGDPCTYRTTCDEPDINGEDGYACGADTGMGVKDGKWVQVREPNRMGVLQSAVAEFLGQFEYRDLEAMHGNGVRVTVSRKRGGGAKVKVDPYNCGY